MTSCLNLYFSTSQVRSCPRLAPVLLLVPGGLVYYSSDGANFGPSVHAAQTSCSIWVLLWVNLVNVKEIKEADRTSFFTNCFAAAG